MGDFLQRSLQGSSHFLDYSIAFLFISRLIFSLDIEAKCEILYPQKSYFGSLSLRMFCDGPNSMIISFLTKSSTLIELNKSAGITHATGQFDNYSTVTINYWFPAFVRGNGPAKSMHQAWNNLMIRILSTNSFWLACFVFWQISQLLTKLVTSCRLFGNQNRFLTKEFVESKSKCLTSSCMPLRMLSCISMWGTNRIPYLVRWNSLCSWTRKSFAFLFNSGVIEINLSTTKRLSK